MKMCKSSFPYLEVCTLLPESLKPYRFVVSPNLWFLIAWTCWKLLIWQLILRFFCLFSFVSVSILLWDIPDENNWITHSMPRFFYNICGRSQLCLFLSQSWACAAEAMGSGPGKPLLGLMKWVPEQSVPC